MKKIFSALMVAAAIFILAACSGSTGYSPEKCEQLIEKIKDNKDLSESEVNSMIDQTGALIKVLKEKEDAMNGDKEKTAEFLQSKEGTDMLGYCIGFAMYLESHKDKLSKDNIQKLDKLKEEINELK